VGGSPQGVTDVARIAGVNLPTNKRIVIALQYIYGIGGAKAQEILGKVSIPESRRVSQLTDQEVLQLREVIDRDYMVSVATGACAIAAVCRCAANARIPTPGPVKARPKQLPARRNNAWNRIM
jgi:hypothetical protein